MDINSLSGVGTVSAPNAHRTSAPAFPGKATGADGGEPTTTVRDAEAAREVQEGRPPVDEKEVQESVDKLNEFVRPYVTSLRFSIDKDLGKVVVKIMDNETQEIIKQFPSEEALELAKTLTEALDKIKGLLVQQQA
ncbi:MAG: flagellar protein FlaG [Azoarcus sp.]|jgi:flagellar protein FlaG|nr:flagellar protein FlaG [Azoarcus sp.]